MVSPFDFDIKIPVYYESKLDIQGMKTDKIVNICRKLGADTYLSGRGAREYLEGSKFEANGIKLMWQEFKHPEYPQVFESFEPYMSAIDLLFNCGPDSVGIIRRP